MGRQAGTDVIQDIGRVPDDGQPKSVNAIADSVAANRKTVGRYLAALADAGLLEWERQGREKRYWKPVVPTETSRVDKEAVVTMLEEDYENMEDRVADAILEAFIGMKEPTVEAREIIRGIGAAIRRRVENDWYDDGQNHRQRWRTVSDYIKVDTTRDKPRCPECNKIMIVHSLGHLAKCKTCDQQYEYRRDIRHMVKPVDRPDNGQTAGDSR